MKKTKEVSRDSGLLEGAFITAIVYVSAILIPMIIICCYVVKCRQHCCLKVMIWVQLGVEFAMCLVCMILSLASQD